MLTLFLPVLLVFAAKVVDGRQPEAPHVVLIVADDLGWAEVSWNNRNVLTPNLEVKWIIYLQSYNLFIFYRAIIYLFIYRAINYLFTEPSFIYSFIYLQSYQLFIYLQSYHIFIYLQSYHLFIYLFTELSFIYLFTELSFIYLFTEMGTCGSFGSKGRVFTFCKVFFHKTASAQIGSFRSERFQCDAWPVEKLDKLTSLFPLCISLLPFVDVWNLWLLTC